MRKGPFWKYQVIKILFLDPLTSTYIQTMVIMALIALAQKVLINSDFEKKTVEIK